MARRSERLDRRIVLQGDDLKLGIFGFLHSSGVSFTKSPDRWTADWADIAAMAGIADAGGIDFLLPYARWKGVEGERLHRSPSFETLSAAAALSGLTRRIGIFSTVHTPIIHPVIAAKILTTIDHASGGRAGVNIVCGWNQADFDMFGLEVLPHEDRYAQGREWFEIWSRLCAGVPESEAFDFNGRFFRDVKGASSIPGTVQRPWPLTISAAYSPTGRSFAIETSDFLLTNASTIASGSAEILQVEEMAATAGQTRAPGTILVCHVVCRETRQQAEAYHHDFAVTQADDVAVDQWIGSRAKTATMPELQEMRMRVAGGGSGMPLIGSPQDVADKLIEIRRAGYAAAAMSFPNYLRDLPLFIDKVLPILERAGVRRAGA